jgi:PPOX class probable F420-dependent enzyme
MKSNFETSSGIFENRQDFQPNSRNEAPWGTNPNVNDEEVSTCLKFWIGSHRDFDRLNQKSLEAHGDTHMKIPQSVREVIEKGPFVHLTTLNRDGSPQVTVVWVGIEGDEFVSAHLALHQKVKNIRRDPRVALSFLSDKTNTQGMREYVVAYGNARATEGGAVALLHRLAPIYLGPGRDYPPPSMQNIAGYVTRIAPARFSGIGPWVPKGAE